MGTRYEVVVAAANLTTLSMLTGWLGSEGFNVAIAPRFGVAKDFLDSGPDLVVSDLKLGEYNGLHLAARAHRHDIPAIVIGPRDASLQRDATEIGALYLSGPSRHDLRWAVEHQLNTARGWRTRLPGRPYSDLPSLQLEMGRLLPRTS